MTGSHKGADHAADAELAVEAFKGNRTPTRRGDIGPAFNLLAAAAGWAGFKIGSDEVHHPGPIYGDA